MDKFWHPKGVKLKYSDNVLSIEHRLYYFSKADSTMPFTIVNTSDWVIIVPELSNGKFVLVKQFRIGTENTTLEFPGGAISAGENPKEAAKRELNEETGLVPGHMIFLGRINPNPALMSNCCFAYYATNCQYKNSLNLDTFEDIEVVEYTQKKLHELINNGDITHSIVLSAYSLFLIRKQMQNNFHIT